MATKKRPTKKRPTKKRSTKKRPTKGSKARPRVFEDCGGSGCKITRVAMRTQEPRTYPGFAYTTPSAINTASPIKPRTRTQRKKAGCKFAEVTYTGKDGTKKSKTIVVDSRAECQDPGVPCPPANAGQVRSTCPVQLFYRQGEMMLRFCRKPKQPGYVRRVASVREAQRVAAKACQCWEKNGRSFEKCVADVGGGALGGVSRRRRRSRRR